MISFPLLTPSMLAREQKTFLCCILVCLGLHNNFPSLNSISHRSFLFGPTLEKVDMSVSLPSDRLTEIQQFAHALSHRHPVTVHQVISFLCKTILYSNGHAQLHWLCQVIQSDMLNVYQSPTQLFFSPFSSYSASDAEAVSAVTVSCFP